MKGRADRSATGPEAAEYGPRRHQEHPHTSPPDDHCRLTLGLSSSCQASWLFLPALRDRRRELHTRACRAPVSGDSPFPALKTFAAGSPSAPLHEGVHPTRAPGSVDVLRRSGSWRAEGGRWPRTPRSSSGCSALVRMNRTPSREVPLSSRDRLSCLRCRR